MLSSKVWFSSRGRTRSDIKLNLSIKNKPWFRLNAVATIKINHRRETMSVSNSNVLPTEESDNILIWLGKLALVIAASAVLAHFGTPRLTDDIRF